MTSGFTNGPLIKTKPSFHHANGHHGDCWQLNSLLTDDGKGVSNFLNAHFGRLFFRIAMHE